MSTFGKDPIPGMPDEPTGADVTLPPAAKLPDSMCEPLSLPELQTSDSPAPQGAPTASLQHGMIVTGFRVLNGPWEGNLFDVPAAPGEYLIGRNDPPGLTVDLDMTDAELGMPPMVSRRHAILRRSEFTSELVIEDVGSTNGTWLNGVRIQPGQPPTPILPDARLRLANIELVAVAGDFIL